jgi:hypothetical protein
VLVLAAVLVALLVPTPQPTNPFTLDPIPASSALPIIGTTRTRTLCTALKKTVAPALVAAMTNDKTYAGFRKSLTEYVITNSPSTRDMQLMRMDRTVDSMVKSIADLETALNSPSFIAPENASQRDTEALIKMRDSLRGVLSAQKTQLDAMSGFVETERMRTFGQFKEGEANLQKSLTPNTQTRDTTYNSANTSTDNNQNMNGAANSNVGIGDNNSSFSFLHDSHDFFSGRSNISITQAHHLDVDLGDLADFTTKREEAASKVIIPATQLCK